MKKYIIILLAFPLLFAQCVKDELLILEEEQTSDLELYINEILSTGDPDWVEFYNATNAEIDLSGFKVSDNETPKYTFPDGTKIASKGYLKLECSTALTAFALSSGGEDVNLWDKDGNLVDHIEFDALDAGVSYGRSTDGGEAWANMSPTPAAANSLVNNPPVITAVAIAGLNDNESFTYKILATDADGINNVKLFFQIGSDVIFVEMAPLGGGEFSYKIPALEAGASVAYYIVATDNSGKKSYFPETAPETKNTFTVQNGLPVFNSVELSNENPSNAEAIDFTVEAYDKTGVKEVRLYYALNDETAKTTVIMTLSDGKWIGTIPGQADETVIHYYLRAEDQAGLKMYYPEETEGGSFDHDVISTWLTVNVAPLELVNGLVINEIDSDGTPDFIELYNGTTAAIDISGYRVYDAGILSSGDYTNAFVVPNGTTIAAGAYYVIEPAFGLSKTSDDVYLENASNVKIDELLGANWPAAFTDAYVIARKKDAAKVWERRIAETKGTTNNLKK